MYLVKGSEELEYMVDQSNELQTVMDAMNKAQEHLGKKPDTFPSITSIGYTKKTSISQLTE